MYAIVKTGGKQYKVAVGNVVEVEKVVGEPGASVDLPALLVVDGSTVTSDAQALAAVKVSGEVVAQVRGPKLRILKYKNKTGYKKRIGHRQSLTQVRVTAIDAGSSATSTDAAADTAATTETAATDTATAISATTTTVPTPAAGPEGTAPSVTPTSPTAADQ